MVSILAAACEIGAGSKPRWPIATLTPEPSTPPADVPLDLDLADKLLHDGEVEQALAIYSAVAGSAESGGVEWRRAVRGAAHLYYQEGRLDDVVDSLTVYLDAEPPREETRRARLLLGAALQQVGSAEEARGVLQDYIDGGGIAAAHARLKLATLSESGREEDALRELELALSEGLPPPQETEALFALARVQEAAGREAEALDTWERLSLDGASAFQRAEALWSLATLSGRTGAERRYRDALASLVSDYPWHPRALESLGQPQFAPGSAERGVVLFNHRLNGQAADAFRDSLEEDGSARDQGRAHYYLALLAEREGQPDEALEEYEAALTALAGAEADRLFGEAAWERALLLEGLGRTDEAVTAYAELEDASPGSVRAPEALFRAGFLRYRQGRPAEATTQWTQYLSNILAAPVAQPEEVARARFWLAKAAIAIGDVESADLHLAEASQAAPWDYFGLRAAALREGQPPLPLSEPAPEAAAPDWAATEGWLASWAGPEVPEDRGELTAGLPWRRGVELHLAGLQDEADDQFVALINETADQPWLLYRLARSLDFQGRAEMAARAADRLIGSRSDAPPEVLRLAYPAEYLDLASAEADAGGFPPLLLLALVRQESFFQPDAESSAGALGLTQVIPSTADDIAARLAEADFTYADLLRPKVSLRFGADYLSSQLELFAGSIPAALAAYNGGPGNTLRWQEAAPADPDVFLETIDLSETRAYVELVLEHYARYRFAYGLAEGPGLPLR